MPEEDADVLEVLIGQMAERSDTNSVFSKALRVLGHAELLEPARNLLRCGTALGRCFRHTVAFQLQRLARSRFRWLAACSGGLFHRLRPSLGTKHRIRSGEHRPWAPVLRCGC